MPNLIIFLPAPNKIQISVSIKSPPISIGGQRSSIFFDIINITSGKFLREYFISNPFHPYQEHHENEELPLS